MVGMAEKGKERLSHWAIDLVETLLQSYPREAKADFIITGVRGSIKNMVWRSYSSNRTLE